MPDASAPLLGSLAARRMIGRSTKYQLAAPNAIATGSTTNPSTMPSGNTPVPRANTSSGMCHR